MRIEVNSSIAFMRFGDTAFCLEKPDWLCACSISATTPLVTPVLMLVPLRISSASPFLIFPDASAWLYSVEPTAASDASLWPDATKSGFASPVYHAGPRELYGATTSSVREIDPCVITAPAVIASGALPGDVMPA